MHRSIATRVFACSAVFGWCLSATLVAEEPKSEGIVLAGAEQPVKDHVKARVYLPVDRLTAGATTRFAVVLEVENGWHINANPAGPDFAIPTTVKVKAKHGTEAAEIDFPEGHPLDIAGLDEAFQVYEGRVVLFGSLTVPAVAAQQTEEITVEVKFQACNDQQCLPPKTARLTGKIPVTRAGEQVKSINEEIFKADTARKEKKEGRSAA